MQVEVAHGPNPERWSTQSGIGAAATTSQSSIDNIAADLDAGWAKETELSQRVQMLTNPRWTMAGGLSGRGGHPR